jgi:mono/diheme cytochrome c family protein
MLIRQNRFDRQESLQMTPSLHEMFRRLINAEGQTRAARTVESFGWIDLLLGIVILIGPYWTAWLLQLPALTDQGANYFRLAGLLVGGLGMLYVVAGRLNAQGFVFASLLDRPLVPVIMAVLWYMQILPGPLALAFSFTDFGGFLWTYSAWREDERLGPETEPPRLVARIAAGFFGVVSGVVRNSRTFHPDGRVFRGTIRSLQPPDASYARAAEQLAGSVLMRIGMGLMKKGWPQWLADRIPDAPSIAMRIGSLPDEISPQGRSAECLDLLCTAGGNRLWKLVLNLATGGWMYGLRKFDYFKNIYFASVPYRIDEGKRDVWIRLVPDMETPGLPHDGPARENGLTVAVARTALVRIEVQPVGDAHQSFVPIAEIRFDEEIEIDQEALHFDPFAARGFEPHGLLTEVRRSVYPASAGGRAASAAERIRRQQAGFSSRLASYFEKKDSEPAAPRHLRRWVKFGFLAAAALFLLLVGYLAVRLTRDRPVEYADDVLHFEYGSTGGERMDGIPYWFWVALPELFPEYLPDKKPGRGYSAFGMIYEPGKDPRYDLPVGMSMRNFRGVDVVYLNCAVCHTSTVREAPGASPRIVPGMPAHTFDLGAWGRFLTTVPTDQKFTPQRLLDQISKMQDDPHRRVDKPDLINRMIFKYLAAYLMRDQLLILGQRLSFINNDSWGPGRVDTFNAPKALLNFPMEKYADPKELIGNVDFPSIWYQGPRKGMQLHWDGNNTSVDERNLSAAFGTGAYPPTLDVDRVLRTAKWLETAKPLAYPYPVDGALAAQGQHIYEQYCTRCHGTREPPFRHEPPQPNELVGTVVPIEKIGTDRWRLDSYTWVLAVNQSTLYAGYEKDWGFDLPYPQRFTHFRKQAGYANSPLDGIWLRAPYLHNGSVPDLWELLKPEKERVGSFYRGNDVYDPKNVGFVFTIPEQDGHKFFLLDTRQLGNGNGGHTGPGYGTDLPDHDKWALIEYLKTF